MNTQQFRSKFIFAFLLFVSCLVGFTGCQDQDNGENMDQPTNTDASYKVAYSQVLEDHKQLIQNYYEEESTALCDLNEDGIPELLFIGGEGKDELGISGPFVLHIFTYINGEAVECPYTHSEYYTDSFIQTDGFEDDPSGGEENGYLVFKLRGDCGFVTYYKLTGLTNWQHLNQFSMSKDGNIKEQLFIAAAQDLEYNTKSFFVKEESVSEEDYENIYENIRDRMETVIFNARGEGDSDDPVIWANAYSIGAVSMTYDEIVSYLSE